VVAHDEARGLFLDRPRRREAASFGYAGILDFYDPVESYWHRWFAWRPIILHRIAWLQHSNGDGLWASPAVSDHAGFIGEFALPRETTKI
jgi:hypothetical protein